MKFPSLPILFCINLAVLAAGCTTQPPAQVTPTPPATTVPATAVIHARITDPALAGTWTMGEFALEGAPFAIGNATITANFDASGYLIGSGGCNTCGTSYNLTGKVMPSGKGIPVGHIVSTQLHCGPKSTIDGYYFEILQIAATYETEGNNNLSIRDDMGSVLVYPR